MKDKSIASKRDVMGLFLVILFNKRLFFGVFVL